MRNRVKTRSPAIRRLPRADDRASSRASAQRLRRPRRRAKRNSQVPSRSAPSAPRADPISWRTAEACSLEAPKRCNVCSGTAPSSRGRAAAPSRRSVPALLLPEAKQRRPQPHRQADPDPRSVRARCPGRCRRCARARHSTSCGSAARISADCVVTFRRAEAGSSLASPRTPRTCRPIVPRRSPPHAGNIEIALPKACDTGDSPRFDGGRLELRGTAAVVAAIGRQFGPHHRLSGSILYDATEAAELGEPGAVIALIDLRLSQNAQFRDKPGGCALAERAAKSGDEVRRATTVGMRRRLAQGRRFGRAVDRIASHITHAGGIHVSMAQALCYGLICGSACFGPADPIIGSANAQGTKPRRPSEVQVDLLRGIADIFRAAWTRLRASSTTWATAPRCTALTDGNRSRSASPQSIHAGTRISWLSSAIRWAPTRRLMLPARSTGRTFLSS